MYDVHVHSNYSDGGFLFSMIDAAEDAGLDGLGFADHCVVSDRDPPRELRDRFGFTLDATYGRRRRAIEGLRKRSEIEIYDAVEMDYVPEDEPEIRAFLDRASFEYSIGSVHVVDGLNIQSPSTFIGMSDERLDAVVDRYFDQLVKLVESELFDVVAHADLVERTPALRGRATEDHYRRAADALADANAIPEINAGRALTDAALVHPDDAFLDAICERGIPITIGSDAHTPTQLRRRVPFLADYLERRDLSPVEPRSLVADSTA